MYPGPIAVSGSARTLSVKYSTRSFVSCVSSSSTSESSDASTHYRICTVGLTGWLHVHSGSSSLVDPSSCHDANQHPMRTSTAQLITS